MRFCQVCRGSIFHQHGGMLEAAWESSRILAAAGHRVVYLTSHHPAHDKLSTEGVDLLFSPKGEAMKYSLDFFSWCRDTFFRLHKTKPFDLVISHSTAARDLLRREPRVPVPVVMVDHGTGWATLQNKVNMVLAGDERWGERIETSIIESYRRIFKGTAIETDWGVSEREALRWFDGVIAVSRQAAVDLQLKGQLSNVFVVHNPVKAARSVSTSAGPWVAIFSSTSPIKGFKYLRAILDVAKHPIKVIGPVGDNRLNTDLVKYTGTLPSQEVQPAMDGCSLYLDLATHYSGFNLSTTRALALGIPAVGWQTPTMAPVDSCGAGIMVPMGDVDALVRAAYKVQSSWDMYHENALAMWRKLFAPERYVEAILDIKDRLRGEK